MNVFPDNSLLVEEFEKVRQLAVMECNGEAGRERVMEIAFQSEYVLVLKQLEETEEMRRVLTNGEPFPSVQYPDIRQELKLLFIRNSVLAPLQILQINKIVNLAALIFAFFRERNEKYPLLSSLLSGLVFEKEIRETIESVMDDTGYVLSGASQELARIRKNLSRKRIESEQLYSSLIQKYRKSGWLTDAEESWRNGRRVVSILAEQKRSARGIIHDISATGKTCFVEPEEAIGVNNLILSLEEEERMEIQRIMRELTAFLRKFHPLLSRYFDVISRYDMISAKARVGIRMKAVLPYVESVPKVDVQEACHPLLFLYNAAAGKKTIPFSLRLQGEERILVISGPNAGGKTVCMKTIGLLQMMLQAGFLVTADGNSRFGVFKNILVDIGDSQSLEFELSTYSSRLRHMKIFLQKASADSLFLIDEFGTGTDPSLGGALAEAILEELNHKKAVGIITTHYMNLKVLADRTRGIINGSMAFDAKKLEPLYALVVGKPGSSYTFVVAERSGLPYSVINSAKKKVKRNNLLLEELLTKVDREKGELQRVMEINKSQEKRLHQLVEKYEKNVAHQEEKIEQNEDRIRQKELRLSRQLEDKFNRFVKDWKEAKNKKAVLEKYNKRLQERKNELSEKDKLKLEELVAFNRKNLKKGITVRLRNGKVTGKVESIKEDKITVVFGNIKTVADLNNLLIVEEGKENGRSKGAGVQSPEKST
ncbi:MAG: DNA mismatch repair protein MutS [Bacteroidia bacterium]|nr:DNA mismatch repair protein MutS [Bacteroidia bacterium]